MTAKINAQVKKSFDAMQAAIAARVQAADNDNLRKNLNTESRMLTLPQVEYALSIGIDMQAIANQISVSDKHAREYVGIYVLQKVRKTLAACAQGIKNTLDPYTRTIVANLCESEQNNKSAQVALSRSVEFDEFDTQKTIKARYNCAATTASTQMSSTRQALMILDAASVSKGKVNDEFALTDSKIANRLREMFKKA